LGNKDNQDTVVCLDSTNGKEVWKYTYACELDPKAFEGGPLSTPTIDGSRLYTLSKFGHCFCFDAKSGAVLWSRKFAPPVLTKADYHVWWGFAGSMVIVGQRLIVPAGPAAVCLDKMTGDVLWDNGPGHPGYSTPVLFKNGSRESFALVSGHEIVAAEVQTGKVLWKTPWKTTWDQNASDVLVSDGRMFVATGHGVGAASFEISGEQPVRLWSNKNMRTYFGNCLLWKGHVYGFDDRQLRCLDRTTGDVKWSAADQGLGTLILADDKLIVLTENGTLRVAKAIPEAFQPVAEAKVLEGRCWSTPALANGRLYLRNAAGDAVCLDLTRR
jgi:outer membrane protein assembly factor BamB